MIWPPKAISNTPDILDLVTQNSIVTVSLQIQVGESVGSICLLSPDLPEGPTLAARVKLTTPKDMLNPSRLLVEKSLRPSQPLTGSVHSRPLFSHLRTRTIYPTRQITYMAGVFPFQLGAFAEMLGFICGYVFLRRSSGNEVSKVFSPLYKSKRKTVGFLSDLLQENWNTRILTS